MKYFFSSEKGSCRPFWYGGCKIDVHNFYPTLEECKLSCGNHYPVDPSHFNRTVHHYEKKEDKKEDEKTTTTAIPVTTTTPELISWITKLAPIDISISGEETTTTTTESPPISHPSIPTYTVYPIEHSIKNRGSISYSTTDYPAHPAEEEYEETESPPSIPAGASTDPCDDPIDPKLEEECTETWEYRSYFDGAAKKCVKFWFGGCEVKSRNLFLDAEACRAVCHHKMNDTPVISTVAPPTTPPTVPSTTSIIPTSAPLRECLGEHRRESSSRECGKEGRNWTQRYFFDHSTRACRMYWGCEGTSSPNNFPDLLTCQWKCEPQRILPNVKSCLDPLDPSLEDDCNAGNFLTKFHFDFQTKKCVAFHYGGCRSSSRNVFDGVEECKTTCERPDHTISQSCLEPFDRGFLNTCNVNSRFEPKYYFDSSTGSCEMFWWGGCRRGAANFFVSIETCRWSCERPKKSEGPKQCHDKFDKQLTEACQDGQWRERFYFDHDKSSCVPFWWDGCHSESANFFRDLDSCQSLCERNVDSEIGSIASTLKEEFRCLEPKKVGECRETYPAYYYDRVHRECRPFSYSGCGGNGNRFLTLAQCEGLCRPFTLLSEVESSCYLPLDTGHSVGECGKAATVSFHYDRNSGSCAQFWFRGCGGNGNRFDSIATCNRICAVKRRPGPSPIRKRRSTHGNQTVPYSH
ncbi:mec-1 [Pristionchus pacificus]|nr:mec-1 [Pristionchus pacificus]